MLRRSIEGIEPWLVASVHDVVASARRYDDALSPLIFADIRSSSRRDGSWKGPWARLNSCQVATIFRLTVLSSGVSSQAKRGPKKPGRSLYRRPRATQPEPGHKIYPYLLRGLEITRPNQVWAMDITYVPMAKGFVYLAVVLDWFGRRVLS
jgi:transposase InsO family protein